MTPCLPESIAGGGEVSFRCPIVRELKAINLVDEGKIKKIRGVAYTTRVSPQIANRMVDTGRGVLNNYIPDVFITTDAYKGKDAGGSPGFALSLIAESTTGMLLSAQKYVSDVLVICGVVCSSLAVNVTFIIEHDRSSSIYFAIRMGATGDLPEDIGKIGANMLCEEIATGLNQEIFVIFVDSTYSFVF